MPLYHFKQIVNLDTKHVPEVQALILNRAWHKTCLNCGIPGHLVDGKSDWLISIMKDFDCLQVHILNNSFKNSSVKATIIKVIKFHYRISSNFFSFMLYGRK
jgi:hypothetical protein